MSDEGEPVPGSGPEAAAPAFGEGEAATTADSTMLVPYFDTALASGEVPFTTVTSAYYMPQNDPEDGDEIFVKYYPQLVDAFEKKHGAIRESFFFVNGEVQVSGAVTDKDDLHLVFPLTARDEGTTERLLFECEHIAHDAARLLEGIDRRRIVDGLYGICTYLLELVATSSIVEPNQKSFVLDLVQQEMAGLRTRLRDASQRRAQIEYFNGMMRTLAMIVVGVVIAGVVEEWVGLPIAEPGPLLTVVLMGAIGAGISVMYRMSFRRLRLDDTAGGGQLRRLGMVRPAIGAAFAVATYFLLGSGIVRLELPSEDRQRLYFFATAAFLAGFSERWAQDMLVVAEGRVRPQQTPEITPPVDQPEGTPPVDPSGGSNT